MRLLLISGDDPLARRRLALAQVGPEDDVLDASGEELLTEAGRFDLLAALDHRWQALLPGLGPWLDLMEFPRAADRLPLLPGLEEVLLALELNDRICRCQARRLVVLLPATTAARRLLSGLSSAPELLERLYDPLLRRLGGLRQTIAGLESKGHLGAGADADITVYRPDRDLARMFALPAQVFKAGILVAEDGAPRHLPSGRTLAAFPLP